MGLRALLLQHPWCWMPRVLQAVAFGGAMEFLAVTWIASKQPGAVSRGADRFWQGGGAARCHRPPLPGKLIKCLLMRLLCSRFADSFVSFHKCSLGRISGCLDTTHSSANTLVWEVFSSGLRLILSRSISACYLPPPSSNSCMQRCDLGTCTRVLLWL